MEEHGLEVRAGGARLFGLVFVHFTHQVAVGLIAVLEFGISDGLECVFA